MNEIEKRILVIQNEIRNAENLLNVIKNEKEKNKINEKLKELLNELHILRKMKLKKGIKTKYLKNNFNSYTNEVIENECLFDDVIKEYIDGHTQIKIGDKIKLNDGRIGFVEGIYVNTLLKDDNHTGIIVTLKRASKYGKKHHLWLSKYGLPIEEIKEII